MSMLTECNRIGQAVQALPLPMGYSSYTPTRRPLAVEPPCNARMTLVAHHRRRLSNQLDCKDRTSNQTIQREMRVLAELNVIGLANQSSPPRSHPTYVMALQAMATRLPMMHEI